MFSDSVMCDSLQPHRLLPTRLLCPCNFPDNNTGVGCHFFFQSSFPNEGSNLSLLHLLHWQVYSLPLCHLGNLICQCAVLCCSKSLQLCSTLCDPMYVSCQVPMSRGFSRQNYWSGLSWPLPGDLPKSGTESTSLMSPTLAGGSLPLAPPGKYIDLDTKT